MDGWKDGWVDGRMGRWMSGRWKEGWMDEWMDGWKDGWMDGSIHITCCFFNDLFYSRKQLDILDSVAFHFWCFHLNTYFDHWILLFKPVKK